MAAAQGLQQRNLPEEIAPPALAITAVNGDVAEGRDGAATATVSLSAPSDETVTVDWQTADGTADAGEDYTAAAATLTFAPGGPLAQKISVAILDDTEHEPNPETFYIDLSNASNATIDPNNDWVAVSITSDDAATNNPPVFDAGTDAFSVAENTTAVGAVTATDPDVGDSVTFTLVGGADEAKFAITPEGALTFLTAPDHERPADSGGDNGYEVVARASDGSLTADQSVTVTVTDAAETDATLKALFLSDQDGNPVDIGAFDPATTAYAASVGNGVTGVTATATPNHPGRRRRRNRRRGPGGGGRTRSPSPLRRRMGNATQDYVITVSRAAAELSNSPPVFDAGTDAFSVAENTTAVGAVTATDPDVGDSVTLHPGRRRRRGQVRHHPGGGAELPDRAGPRAAPPTSAVTTATRWVARASDGSLTADQTITVTVTDRGRDRRHPEGAVPGRPGRQPGGHRSLRPGDHGLHRRCGQPGDRRNGHGHAQPPGRRRRRNRRRGPGGGGEHGHHHRYGGGWERHPGLRHHGEPGGGRAVQQPAGLRRRNRRLQRGGEHDGGGRG